jgi:hypothetical protein
LRAGCLSTKTEQSFSIESTHVLEDAGAFTR